MATALPTESGEIDDTDEGGEGDTELDVLREVEESGTVENLGGLARRLGG